MWIVRDENVTGWREVDVGGQLSMFERSPASSIDAIVHRLPARDRRRERRPWPAEAERRRRLRLERKAS